MTSKTVSSFAEFITLLSLKNVRVYEVSARRRDGFDTEEVPVDDGFSDLHVQQGISDEGFTFRARIEIRSERAIIRSDVAAIFEVAEEISRPPNEVLDEFAHEAGLPATMPYLRVYVQQAARLIGVSAPLIKHYWGSEMRQLEMRHDKPQDDEEDPEMLGQ
ncbi:hypothetical protein EV382_5355 [Micromonospora violae]|uniref:Preprotein translocase subunit SecB n=1 Tax=Micromonospora violae TaxID=1278207 RepID=A0A4Q7UKU5_9ACTN|nr:hypothetical protein [Micromonospora violae]RZT82055.1 hypothetical protein EV382_5355 [Micromonospora violae]